MDINDLNVILKHLVFLRENGVKRLIIDGSKVEIEFIEKAIPNIMQSMVINKELSTEKGQSSTDSEDQGVDYDLYHVD